MEEFWFYSFCVFFSSDETLWVENIGFDFLCPQQKGLPSPVLVSELLYLAVGSGPQVSKACITDLNTGRTESSQQFNKPELRLVPHLFGILWYNVPTELGLSNRALQQRGFHSGVVTPLEVREEWLRHCCVFYSLYWSSFLSRYRLWFAKAWSRSHWTPAGPSITIFFIVYLLFLCLGSIIFLKLFTPWICPEFLVSYRSLWSHHYICCVCGGPRSYLGRDGSWSTGGSSSPSSKPMPVIYVQCGNSHQSAGNRVVDNLLYWEVDSWIHLQNVLSFFLWERAADFTLWNKGSRLMFVICQNIFWRN